MVQTFCDDLVAEGLSRLIMSPSGKERAAVLAVEDLNAHYQLSGVALKC
ncbi:predicted protein [Plenodomus lingam JN3]|uniref:Predicted protein n=1 Tax=Leptosphaeria maculans (strain JN3 / isolate v23.1.3 / race Av1-4-5-6-7-8) TaxID=985895 RepID=E4ZH56_LEPMJ|nr:predicted protein [Plenodomus lingam JN3]CBX90626.1 predicted protein [Plenodomus lingam JN3]